MILDWPSRAAELTATLAAGGALTDARWLDALRGVPRHVFVPRFYEQRPDLSGWETVSDGGDPDRWADAVYSDRALVTELRATSGVFDGYPVPISSSTLPSLMARMLHLLDVEDGMDVVEIGTGTGYNTALLCARLGDRHVASVDVEPGLIEAARDRLGATGAHPTLSADDASDWEPPPYDRLIATCGARAVASAWLRSARPDAVLVMPLTGSLADGGLARLVADGRGTAAGRFASFYAGFMPLRSDRPTPVSSQASGFASTRGRTSSVDPGLLAAHEPLALVAQPKLPRLEPRCTTTTDAGRPVTMLNAADGSWVRAEHRDGGATVRCGGPTDLWGIVEDAHDWWISMGRPGWERFGLSATQDVQTIWLDEPGNEIDRQPTTTRP